jgi:hypothetical protein
MRRRFFNAPVVAFVLLVIAIASVLAIMVAQCLHQ